MAVFYIDVNHDSSEYDFYYNTQALINDHVCRVLGIKPDDIKTLPRDKGTVERINNGNALRKRGNSLSGRIGVRDMSTGKITTQSILDIDGICATVNMKWAEEILERAKFYCPKARGNLCASGRIEVLDNHKCMVVFGGYVEETGILVDYAWYVHEYTFKKHNYPERAKFLTQAVYEVEKLHGINWA